MTRSQSAHERENDEIGVQELYKRLFCDPNLVDTFKNILICVEIVLCIPVLFAKVGFQQEQELNLIGGPV